MKSILISHSNLEPDKTISLALYEYLSAQKIDCWIDAKLKAGVWDAQIGKVMYDAPIVIFVASRNSMIPPEGVDLSEVMKEVGYFVRTAGKTVLPFVIDKAFYMNLDKKASAALYEFGNNSRQAVFLEDHATQEQAFERLVSLLPHDISHTVNDPADFEYDESEKVLLAYKGHDAHVEIPSYVCEIGKEAFRNNGDLIRAVVPPSVKKIGIRAFFGCKNLVCVEGMDGVEEVEASAFEFSGLDPEEHGYEYNGILFGGDEREISIPDTVRVIAADAFRYGAFQEVRFPQGLRAIGETAFADNPFLTSVTFPSSVTHIGKNAFRGCKRLREAVFEGEIPAGAQQAFEAFEEIVNKERKQ